MTLGELIEKRRHELGNGRRPMSYEDLAARAREQGHSLSQATITDYANHPPGDRISQRVMRAIAAALGVPFNVVLAALAATIADDEADLVQAAEEPHVRDWVTLSRERTPAERAAMLAAGRAVAEALSAGRAAELASEDPDLDANWPENDQTRNVRNFAHPVTDRARHA